MSDPIVVEYTESDIEELKQHLPMIEHLIPMFTAGNPDAKAGKIWGAIEDMLNRLFQPSTKSVGLTINEQAILIAKRTGTK